MDNQFSKRLKELRKEKGCSQEELATELSMKRYLIGNLEQGRTEPDLDMLIKIAKYFDVRTDYLLGLEENLYNI